MGAGPANRSKEVAVIVDLDVNLTAYVRGVYCFGGRCSLAVACPLGTIAFSFLFADSNVSTAVLRMPRAAGRSIGRGGSSV